MHDQDVPTSRKIAPQPYACVGGACELPRPGGVSRRALLQGTALGAAALALTRFGDASAQDDQALIPRLNGGGMGGGSNPQANFNPNSPNRLTGTLDLLFESLYVYDTYSCTEVPWLATAYEWQDPQTLTFTLRDGVTWNDGEPFTADDVVFTYTTLKEYPALDLNGAVGTLDTVTADGSTVTFTFTEPSIPVFKVLSYDTRIIPKHIWEAQDDPVTFVNAENPVGTGPFVLGSFNSESLVWTRNESYWQADKIRIQEIGYSKPAEGQADQLRLANGEYDFNAMFIPNVEQTYVSRDPDHNKYWYASGGVIALAFNLTKAPFNDLNFRKAVAHAINRDDIAQKAQLGYVNIASQTGLVVPGQEGWLNPDIPDQGFIPYDPDQALQILTDAGYTKDGDTLKDPDGNEISFTFKIEGGWTDWIQAGNIIQNNLRDIGINVDVQTPAYEVLLDQKKRGDFDMIFLVHGGDCSMYRNFFDPFASAQSAEIGEAAVSNFERWQDDTTDSLLQQFRSAQDEDEQKDIVYQLQQIVYDNFPTIGLWYGAKWFQYRTANAEGWPSADDPYCSSSDWPIILTHLIPPS